MPCRIAGLVAHGLQPPLRNALVGEAWPAIYSYKERKDKGVRRHLRYKGSLAAVKARQRQAFDALTNMRVADVAAKRETRIMFGNQWSRRAIVDAAEARASSAEAGKEMR